MSATRMAYYLLVDRIDRETNKALIRMGTAAEDMARAAGHEDFELALARFSVLKDRHDDLRATKRIVEELGPVV
jgi:hypothetical protein